jgi:hypothetical protein
MANIKGRCEPAYSIVRRFGGVTPTAKILSLQPSTVSRWLTADGTNGQIPQKYWITLLNHALSRNIKINLADISGIVIE